MNKMGLCISLDDNSSVVDSADALITKRPERIDGKQIKEEWRVIFWPILSFYCTIISYHADDSCFTFGQDFVAGTIPLKNKGPEYWAGWALAFYQWYSGYCFMEILTAAPLEELIVMYSTYHEMDILQFADRMQEKMKAACPRTKLRLRRETCGLSQSELAAISGVPLRQIQLFEQRQRDINRTAAETLLCLSRTLCCRMEDLMER